MSAEETQPVIKKWLWIPIGLVIVTLLIFYLLANTDTSDQGVLKTARLNRGDLRITVAATGVVQPYGEVAVKSKAGGEIINFTLEEGDQVRKGHVVVKLDPDIERSRVNQANADLLIAEARLEKANIAHNDSERRYARKKRLFEENILSQQDLDDAVLAVENAESDIKIAEAELIRARETLKEAKDRLADTEIKAPLTGTILKKYVEEGQVISSTLSSASEGTLLFTMADLNRIYVEALVDETDIGRIKPKQKVAVTVDAYPQRVFEGHVIRIAPKGRVESTITIFDVTVEVADDEKTMLKPMMTANVEILTDLREDVLLISSEAVRAEGKEYGIYHVTGDTYDWVPVTVGSSDGIVTEIQGEVAEGDEIIISGLEKEKNTPDRIRGLRRGFWFFGRKK